MLPLMGLLRAARARPVARIAVAVPRWPATRAQSSAAALTNIIDKARACTRAGDEGVVVLQ